MDPSRGDSRYNLNYSMNSIGLSLADQADLYGNPALIARPPSSGLIQPMIGGGGAAGRNSAGLQMSNSNQCQTLNNTSAGQQQARGIKRTSSDCYEDQQQQQAQIHRSSNPGMTTLQGLESCGGGGSGGPGGNGTNSTGTGGAEVSEESYSSLTNKKSPPANGKKTKGRVKIKMEYIDNKLRRYTTFSKRKTGIMKKAYELSTLTGTQVMLLVASETGHVYTFATRKLQPMITSEAGKQLIQTCLNSPDPPNVGSGGDQRMSATGFEETELSYNIADEDSKDGRFPISSGNETDDSSDVESPGPQPSTSTSQAVLVEDSPSKPMVYYDNFKVTPSTSHHHQQQQQHHQQHPTTSQNTTSQLPQNLSPEVLLGLVQAGHLPQDVLLKLVQSGDLHLHTEEGGQYITIPIPVASTSSKTGLNNKNNRKGGGGSGGAGSSAYIKKEVAD